MTLASFPDPIRLASTRDALTILKLQKKAFFDHIALYHNDQLPMLIQTAEELEDEMGCRSFLIYLHDGQIAGSVRAHVENETCYISTLIVDPEHQNKGIGSKLMSAIEDYFQQAARYELYTGSLSESNLSFYQKIGYSTVRTAPQNELYALVYLEKRKSY